MKRSLGTLILVAASLLQGRPNVPGADLAAASRPIEIGNRACLFLDDRFIAQQAGLTRTWHQGRPQPEPAISATEPWEKWPHLFGSVLYDPESKLYRMWYEDIPARGAVLYAESKDGKTWVKPRFTQYTLKGAKENNCVLYPAELPNVFLEPSDSDPRVRFKMLAWGGPFGENKVSGHVRFASGDGVNWNLVGTYPAPDPTDESGQARTVRDTNEVFWDPLRKRYIGTYRTFPLHPGLPGWSRDEQHRTFPKDGGHRRAVGITTAPALAGPWSPITTVLQADARDDEKVKRLSRGVGSSWAELYAMPAFVYGNHYLGLVSLLFQVDATAETMASNTPYDRKPDTQRGGGDLQLTFSHDGRTWFRQPDRQTLVSPSPTKLVPCYAACNEPLLLGDELWIYYTEADAAHPAPDHQANIRAAVWRRDGFVSLDAKEESALTTHPVVWNGGPLICNVNVADGGSLRAALLDESGQAIKGFDLADCEPLRGDQVQGIVRWGEKPDLSGLKGKTLRLKIELSRASLYSFRAGDAPIETLAGTKPLTEPEDLSQLMMDGLHRFVERKIDESVPKRARHWKRDVSSREAYERSVQPNRERLLRIIGAVDPSVPSSMERFGHEGNNPPLVAGTDDYRIFQVRWPAIEGIWGEGLLLEPDGDWVASVVALPDADQTPEQLAGLSEGIPAGSQFARRLAENGFRVLVPTLISRGNEFSGDPAIAMTNQPHREWIYRQAFHMGRHVIGHEVQKVRAAVDWLKKTEATHKIGVAGYGEGGLIALYAAAADPRIDAALVSGYFGSRQRVWTETIDRNVWGLLDEFGDAELATMIAPRGLVVEHSDGPRVDGPPPVPKGRRGGAAVGQLATPTTASVAAEFERLNGLLPAGFQARQLVQGEGGGTMPFGSPAALKTLAEMLGVDSRMTLGKNQPGDRRRAFDPLVRQQRQVKELERHVQQLVRGADRTRDEFFLNRTTLIKTLAPRGERFRMFRVKEQSADLFAKEVAPLRQRLYDDVIGRIDDPMLEPNPRSRKIYDRPKWTGYEVLLDVYPDVVFWGVLLVPKDLKPDEKRPVVVCQHGRNGLPKDCIEGDSPAYHDFAARLAERGFITFAPHNLYRGEDRYRMLNRKGNPIKLSMFSFITAQHEQLLNWLGTLPFVDRDRIAFYGLSYGGETAVRVPALLERYCLSICSGDFNDWARKVAGIDRDLCFPYTIEWEMPYFNMGSTFNYAELACLIAPRPFMVERGHHDGVAPDEWVAGEYAKVRWLYAQLGLADKTEIEFFNGGHTINGQATYEFLHRHLHWPPAAGTR